MLAGGTLGWLNSLSRTWSVSRLQPRNPGAGVAWVEVGLLLRLALTAALLTFALREGLVAGLCALAGLWAVRWWMVSRMQRGRD